MKATIPFSKIDKIEIYINTGRKTMTQIQKLTMCDYIINGGLFNSNWTPCCQLKVNGTRYIKNTDNYWSLCWNNPNDICMSSVPVNDEKYNNYIACVALKQNGIKETWSISNADNDKAVGYSTKRSAIGLKNGELVLYCSTNNMIPSQLYNYLDEQGWSDILMLDGGGSVQGNFVGEIISSSRIVHNFILVYLKKDIIEPTDYIITANPTLNIRAGAGIDYQKVGYYNLNQRIKITEIKNNWGKTNLGWISMEYVKKYEENNYITNPVNRPMKQLKSLKGLVVHWIGVRQESADVIKNNFQNAKTAGSTQYIIGYDGKIIQTMPENEVAWHVGANSYTKLKQELVGNDNPNYYFVGIECCISNIPLDGETQLIPQDYSDVAKYPNMGKPSKAQTDSLINFVASFCKRNSLNPYTQIYLHNDITGKPCHIYYVNHKDEWENFKKEVAFKMGIEPQRDWYYEAQQYVISNKIADGTRPNDVCTRAEIWQMLYNKEKK